MGLLVLLVEQDEPKSTHGTSAPPIKAQRVNSIFDDPSGYPHWSVVGSGWDVRPGEALVPG
jgi:hypothetical protein